MSYDIFYDKQFVKIPQDGETDKFIPLVYGGSNNCYDTSGRRVREWFNGRWMCPNNSLIATKDEMLEIVAEWRKDLIDRNEKTNKEYKELGKENWIDIYSDNNFGYYASLAIGSSSTRNTSYGNVKGIVLTGVRKSLTVEQLAEKNIYVTVKTSFHDKEKLAELGLESFSNTVNCTSKLIEVLEKAQKYQDQGVYVTISIQADENKMKWLRKTYFPVKKKEKTLVEVDHFYTVKMANGGYLVKRTKNGYKYSYNPYLKYKTEAQAAKRAKSSDGVVVMINQKTTL